MDIEYEQMIKVLSPILTLLIGVIVQKYTTNKPKIVTFVGHISSFQMKDENSTKVYTHSIVVSNTGNKTAMNVRVGHYLFPDNINVYPPVKYVVEENPNSTYEMLFPTLVPGEQVTISYLYFPPVTWDKINAYTKSDEGLAKSINAIPTPQMSNALRRFLLFLIFVGASFVVYLIITYIKNIL